MINLKKIDVVVLCGGLGKRLRSEIGESQKTMAEIDNKPFLNILLENLRDQGFERIILCTGYKAEKVEKYYSDNDLGLDIVFSREREPLGTGGAIKNAKSLIESNMFIVMNGDSFCPVEYSSFINFHVGKSSIASIVISKTDDKDKDRKDYGTIAVDDNDCIERFAEKINEADECDNGKEISLYINAGIYCFDKHIFSLMPEEDKFSAENFLFPRLVGNKFFGYQIDGTFMDIGTPQRYSKAKRILK